LYVVAIYKEYSVVFKKMLKYTS